MHTKIHYYRYIASIINQYSILMQTKTYLAILTVVVAGIAGGAYIASGSGKSQQAAVAETTPVTPVAQTEVTPTDAVVSPVTYKYKDGTYSAAGDYRAPSGAESISVSLTLKDDVVVDSSVTSTATNRETKQYQGKFMTNYKAQVVGKSIDELKLTNVSGSSLTPMGFNTALETIKAAAKA